MAALWRVGIKGEGLEAVVLFFSKDSENSLWSLAWKAASWGHCIPRQIGDVLVKEGSTCFNCATFVQFASFRQALGTAFTKLFCQGHDCVATGEVKGKRCVFSQKKKILLGINECAVSEYIKAFFTWEFALWDKHYPQCPRPCRGKGTEI